MATRRTMTRAQAIRALERAEAAQERKQAAKVRARRLRARRPKKSVRARRRRPEYPCTDPHRNQCADAVCSSDDQLVLTAVQAAIERIPKTVASWPVGHVLVVLVRRTEIGFVADGCSVMSPEQVTAMLSALDGVVAPDKVLVDLPAHERMAFVSIGLSRGNMLCSSVRISLTEHGFLTTGLLGANTVGQA